MPVSAQFCTHCGIDIQTWRDELHHQQQYQHLGQIQEEINIHRERMAFLEDIAKSDSIFALRFTKKGRSTEDIIKASKGASKIIYQLLASILGIATVVIFLGIFFSGEPIIAFWVFVPVVLVVVIIINTFGLLFIVRPQVALEVAKLRARIAELEMANRQLQAGAVLDRE